MKLLNKLTYVLFILSVLAISIFAQSDSGTSRFTSSNDKAYSRDISGDGRFIVIESTGNIATHNPRNTDNSREIFLLDTAQRHIFQITDTKSLLFDTTLPNPPANSNIKIEITNLFPSISNDGKWIAFGSNANGSVCTPPYGGTTVTCTASTADPGSFDANSFTPTTGTNPLLNDANVEAYIYQVPQVASADLSSGITPAFTNLAGGIFTRITNTPTSDLPVAGTTTSPPYLSEDSRNFSINDDGLTVAFVSTRDLIPGGNSYPADDNAEIFIYKRLLNSIAQVTRTSRGPVLAANWSYNPSISGDGSKVVFVSVATNPIIGMTNGNNPDHSAEIYLSELSSSGSPDGSGIQVTDTMKVFESDVLNIFVSGRRISRDGRYIAFESSVELDTSNHTSTVPAGIYATFVYDSQSTATNPFKRVVPFGNADSVPNGESLRMPVFTDYQTNSRTPSTIIFASRMNLCADGTANCSAGGLNPSSSRPIQVYSYNLSGINPVKKISNSPLTNVGRSADCFSANSRSRISCSVKDAGSYSEGNTENYYLLTPDVTQEDPAAVLNFYTGASSLSVGSAPAQFQGLKPNMLGSVVYTSQLVQPDTGFAVQVSTGRNFAAPLQLKGISMTIDGISAKITGIRDRQIIFIVPKEITTAGNKAVVINHKGVILRGNVQIVQSSVPDIVRTDSISLVQNYSELIPAPNGRARILNVTDPNNQQTEPFTVTTQTSTGTFPTKLRLFLTGVQGVPSSSISIKIGNTNVSNNLITTNAVESDYPGIFTVDFEVPSQIEAGHLAVVVTVNGQSSRTFETAPRIRFLPNQLTATDLAVWRKGSGTWWVMGGEGATQIAVQWGITTDMPAPGDYDGDGKTDFCVFRPSEGNWYYLSSSNSSFNVIHFGTSEDKIAQADYDGDGKVDFAVWRPSDTKWYVSQSSNGQLVSSQFGISTDKVVPADYDGDGKADWAVWRSSDGQFWIKKSSNNQIIGTSFGQTGDKPVIGDYDGDGKADLATWRGSDNVWRILQSSNNQEVAINWGLQNEDVEVQGDYDFDGKTDVAVWRSGWWYIRKSSNGQMRAEQWGQAGDIPVPANW